MNLFHAIILFIVISLAALWMYVTNNPGDPLTGAMVTASLWLLAIALGLLAVYTVIRSRAKGR